MGTVADLGVRIGSLPSGPTGSVVDVPGVGLGHATIVYDDPPPPFGRGCPWGWARIVDVARPEAMTVVGQTIAPL